MKMSWTVKGYQQHGLHVIVQLGRAVEEAAVR